MQKLPSRSAAAGLSLTLVLVSLQPAVPAAAQVLGAAADLSTQSERLTGEVSAFVASVMAG